MLSLEAKAAVLVAAEAVVAAVAEEVETSEATACAVVDLDLMTVMDHHLDADLAPMVLDHVDPVE